MGIGAQARFLGIGQQVMIAVTFGRGGAIGLFKAITQPIAIRVPLAVIGIGTTSGAVA